MPVIARVTTSRASTLLRNQDVALAAELERRQLELDRFAMLLAPGRSFTWAQVESSSCGGCSGVMVPSARKPSSARTQGATVPGGTGVRDRKRRFAAGRGRTRGPPGERTRQLRQCGQLPIDLEAWSRAAAGVCVPECAAKLRRWFPESRAARYLGPPSRPRRAERGEVDDGSAPANRSTSEATWVRPVSKRLARRTQLLVSAIRVAPVRESVRQVEDEAVRRARLSFPHFVQPGI